MGEEFWKEHVAAAKLEGISGSAYAKRHGISVTALYYWQRKLNETTGVSEAKPTNKFVALQVAEAIGVHRSGGGCTLILGSGMRLEMLALPEPEWLAALGRAVQGAR